MINIYDFKQDLDSKNIRYHIDGNNISFVEGVQGISVLFGIFFEEVKISILGSFVLGRTYPPSGFYEYLNQQNNNNVFKYAVAKLDDGNWVMQYSITLFKSSISASECFDIVVLMCKTIEDDAEETKRRYYR